MTLPPDRIERAARAIDPGAWKSGYEEVFAERWAASLRIASDALAAAYPELASGSHWVAPMEPTLAMINAALDWPAAVHWDAMRDAYLSQPDKDKT